MKTYLITIFCLLFSWVAIAAQEPVRQPSTIRTNGEAVINVKPDRAQIDIGVVTQMATSQETVDQNSRQLEAVVAGLRKLLGANADIKTISFGLAPKYRYVPQQPPAEPNITGYTATNIVRVIVTDLKMLGKVIDTAGAAGANQIQGLQFMAGNQQAAQAQALSEAVLNARRRADQLAAAMGVKILRIIFVNDTTPPVPIGAQYNMQFFAGSRDPNVGTVTSISAPAVFAPNTIEVKAMVSLSLEIAP